MTTRTGGGRVPALATRIDPARSSAESGDELRHVRGEDLSPVKARVLLMLALAKTRDGTEIQRMFTAYWTRPNIRVCRESGLVDQTGFEPVTS